MACLYRFAPTLFVLLAPSVLQADVIGVEITQSFAISGSTNRTVGWEFTPNESLTVESLGYLDWRADGLEGSHDVGIWTSAGDLVTSATVPAGTVGELAGTFTHGGSFDNGFRFVDIPSVTLDPGTNYVVGAFYGTNDITTLYDSLGTRLGFSVPAELTYVQPRQLNGAPFSFPSGTNIGVGYFNANFRFEPSSIPEPTTLPLWAALGSIGWGVVYRKTRSQRPSAENQSVPPGKA